MKTGLREDVNVIICWHWDPLSPRPGGIDTFIADFVKYAPAYFKFTLFIMTARKEGKFKLSRLQIGGKECNIIPVVVWQPGLKSSIPLRLKYAIGIYRYSRKNKLSANIIHYHGFEPWLGMRSKVLNEHILFFHQDPLYRWNFKSESRWRLVPINVYSAIEKIILPYFSHIFFINRNSYNSYSERYPNIKERMTPISTWVDTKAFYLPQDKAIVTESNIEIAKKLNLPREAKVVLFFGRFDEIKNPILLIDAFYNIQSKLKDVHLLLVGEGSLEEKMKRLVGRIGISDKVHFIKTQPKEEIKKLLWLSTLSVLPSRNEGMSMAINESLACGCPVVGFDVGGIRQVVMPGISGEIIQTQTAEALGEGILTVLQNPSKYTKEVCIKSVEKLTPQNILSPVYKITEYLFNRRDYQI